MKQSLQVASQVELHWPQVEQKSLVALLLCRYVLHSIIDPFI